ncbi:MAG: hypothetical protein KF819_14530 [Labilithrix sp.]|nr:hypothetical protein [Labilithrix sp.]
MRLAIACILVASSLSTVVGCGASAQQPTVPSINVAESRDEASWTPPEAMEGMIKSEEVQAQEARAVRPNMSFRPNREERPARGAVHAATY